MNILGIELESNRLNYVLLVGEGDEFEVAQFNRLVLTDTRSRESLRSFHDATKTMFNGTKPDIIGVKDKPESGRLRAGAAALKMEGIMLACATCDVDFVSGKRINACENREGLKVYLQPAFKAAVAAVRKLATA
ncbi:DUF3010 family protein [Mesorhizobium sp. M0119]|uniref:DUF3010 family protein n=1 Tax=Mesorhizobium sp. M0119 TaxID=2956885 RepID=UPI00333AB87C